MMHAHENISYRQALRSPNLRRDRTPFVFLFVGLLDSFFFYLALSAVLCAKGYPSYVNCIMVALGPTIINPPSCLIRQHRRGGH